MFASGDLEFADSAASFGSPELAALTDALIALVAESDGVAEAVARHDREAIATCNERAEGLVERVNRLTAGLTSDDKALLGDVGVPALCQRLAACARRNAYLIEQAWAVDAALMRLLLGAGRVDPDGVGGGYSTPSGPTYVDRGA